MTRPAMVAAAGSATSPATLAAPPGNDTATGVGVGVLGATGYAGAELIRLLSGHPHARLRAAGSRRHAGAPLAEAVPAITTSGLTLDAIPACPEAWRARGVDVVFSALPHGAFAARARGFLDAGIRVIDLSSDFRLKDPEAYPRRYGYVHPEPDLLGGAVYGLAEWCEVDLVAARIIANPGCYATACLLACLPAVRSGWNAAGPIHVNALSGISGAGRAASLATHFVECEGGATPYKVGDQHPHLGEIGQMLAGRGAGSVPIVFNPHLVPMSRGILASVAIPLSRPMGEPEARDGYRDLYAEAPFVRVLEGAALPHTRDVRGSNRCDIAVRTVAEDSVLLVFSAIDNLVKGAAGQAIQNWNRMQGWPETTGLPVDGWGCA